jgi:NAD(P)H-dependent FMN reductase
MIAERLKVLTICGSLRKKSYNAVVGRTELAHRLRALGE